MKLFVYGSLKRNKHNFHKMGSSIFISEIELPVKGNLMMNITNPRNYPHFIKDETAGFIKGELFEVPDNMMTELDRFEGHPSFFCRDSVEIDNDIVYYYHYVGHKTYKEDLKDFKIINTY